MGPRSGGPAWAARSSAVSGRRPSVEGRGPAGRERTYYGSQHPTGHPGGSGPVRSADGVRPGGHRVVPLRSDAGREPAARRLSRPEQVEYVAEVIAWVPPELRARPGVDVDPIDPREHP